MHVASTLLVGPVVAVARVRRRNGHFGWEPRGWGSSEGPQSSVPLVESHDPRRRSPSRNRESISASRISSPKATNQPFPRHAARARLLLLAIGEGAPAHRRFVFVPPLLFPRYNLSSEPFPELRWRVVWTLERRCGILSAFSFPPLLFFSSQR